MAKKKIRDSDIKSQEKQLQKELLSFRKRCEKLERKKIQSLSFEVSELMERTVLSPAPKVPPISRNFVPAPPPKDYTSVPPIPPSNLGYEMLGKLGWIPGQSIGSDPSQPVVEIPLVQKLDKRGVGFSFFSNSFSSPTTSSAPLQRDPPNTALKYECDACYEPLSVSGSIFPESWGLESNANYLVPLIPTTRVIASAPFYRTKSRNHGLFMVVEVFGVFYLLPKYPNRLLESFSVGPFLPNQEKKCVYPDPPIGSEGPNSIVGDSGTILNSNVELVEPGPLAPCPDETDGKK